MNSVKQSWLELYKSVPQTLDSLKQVKGVASTFNANIDAVLKVTPAIFEKVSSSTSTSLDNYKEGIKSIQSPNDVLRGFLQCFAGGIAQEWLVEDLQTFAWMKENLGHDRMQMGGQGGIIANVMSVCEVQKVYVHCASLNEQQAELFLPNENLLSTNSEGKWESAYKIARKEEPLIHWILEFNGGDQITIGDQVITCPKSNRFIATYDPLNFILHTDSSFIQGLQKKEQPLDCVLLAGYQMLSENLPNGTSGIKRIDESWNDVASWKSAHPDSVVHFEFASTQDKVIRKHLLETIAQNSDSIGLNEQELIDALDVMDRNDLAEPARKSLHAPELFAGLQALLQKTNAPRIQLHMFGLYLTLLKPNHFISAEKCRDGMALAATLAAGKAGTGSIEEKENLLWAHSMEVADVSLNELNSLAELLETEFSAQNFNKEKFLNTGVFEASEFTVVALPTILVPKPVTLVGMGDTISSLSLVGSL